MTYREWARLKRNPSRAAEMVLDYLVAHTFGEQELSPTQIRTAEIYLRKRLPDLASVAQTTDVTVRHAEELSREELLRIAAGGGEGVAAETGSDGEPAGLH